MASSNFEWLQKGTFAMLDLWLHNFSRNIPDLIEGKSIKSLSVFDSSNPLNQPSCKAVSVTCNYCDLERNIMEFLISELGSYPFQLLS